MNSNTPSTRGFIIGLILIFSTILIFFGFFFLIVFNSDFIFDNPFTFIFLFFTMFFAIAIIVIIGVFQIQKSQRPNNYKQNFNEMHEGQFGRNTDELSIEQIKAKNFEENKSYCSKCGSTIYSADVFCLNCGNKLN